MKASRKYGPIETENDRVGVVDAESPEAREDDHGMAALKKRRRGGKVEGNAPAHRMDRPHRAHGGSVKGKKGITINIINAGQGGGPGARPPMPMPPLGGAPVPPPVMAHPPAPPMAGGPPMPGAMPPGGMMRKSGGRVGGGHAYPKMDAGALGGEARLEKIEKYGAKARSGEGK